MGLLFEISNRIVFLPFSNQQFVAVFGDYSLSKWRLTIVAVLVTVAAENGDYRRQRQRLFVVFLVTLVAVIVAKNGVVEKA